MDAPRTRVRREQREQPGQPPQLVGSKQRVMEHHACRAISLHCRNEPRIAIRTRPVDADLQLSQPVELERSGARVADERAEAELDQAAARRLRAAVPGRREDRRRLAEQLPQPACARGDVTPLRVSRPGGAELARPAQRLVVRVREPVLVKGEQAALRLRTAPEGRRQPSVERGRDDRDVERDRGMGEDVEKGEQPPVGPARVVVAEVERARRVGRVELRAERLEPGAVPAQESLLPASTSPAVRTMPSTRSVQAGASRWNGCGARTRTVAATYQSRPGGREP